MFCLVGGCGCDSDFWVGYECIAGQVGECCKSRRLTAFGKAYVWFCLLELPGDLQL